MDTNVIVAAFATRGLCSDLIELCLAEHRIILSEQILQEIHRNLTKKLNLPHSIVTNIEQSLRAEGQIITPSHVPQNACRDKTDLMVLGTAEAGNADVIITGDNDLLVLHQFKSTKILSPRMFWNLETKKG